MKYTIEGFSQEFALTLKKQVVKKDKMVEIKIDCTDLVILRWFVDFYPKMKKMIVDGKEFAWLTHKKLLEDLPIIDISRNAFIERMQKLVEFDILEYRFIKEGGTFSLYTFGTNYENLINKGDNSCGYGVLGQTDTGVLGQTGTGVLGQTGTGVLGQTGTKDNTIIKDIYIKDIEYIIGFLNEKADVHYRPTTKETQQKIIKLLKQGFDKRDFEQVITTMVTEWKGNDKMEKYLRPQTLFSDKFESYLNRKVAKKTVGKSGYTREELDEIDRRCGTYV